jgi:hypothetical protein
LKTEAGAVPATAGWFVLNARDARWGYTRGMGHGLPLTGIDEGEAEALFPMLGMAIRVMNPGEPSTTYHWETEQEDFLVLAGEAILLIEGKERRFVSGTSCTARRRRGTRSSAPAPVRVCCCAPALASFRRTGRGVTTAQTRSPSATTRVRVRTPTTPISPTIALSPVV